MANPPPTPPKADKPPKTAKKPKKPTSAKTAPPAASAKKAPRAKTAPAPAPAAPAPPAFTAVTRTPLSTRTAITHADYHQAEAPPIGKLILRAKEKDPVFTAALSAVTQIAAPLHPNTTAAGADGDRLLWMGPEEHILWTNHLPARTAAIAQALDATHAAIVNVSDYYTHLHLGGAAATTVLAHGCPLDLRIRAFPAGACAQSHYRQAGILLYRHADDADGWTLQIRRSFADYLWDYLAQVAALAG